MNRTDVQGGRLELRWTYSTARHLWQTIQMLAETAHAPSFAASDLEAFGWTEENIAGIAAEIASQGGADESH